MCQHVYFSCFTVHHWNNNCNPLSELTTQKFLFMFAYKKNTPQRQQYTWVKKRQHYPLNETCIHAAYFTLESLCCFSSKNLYRKKNYDLIHLFLQVNYCHLSFKKKNPLFWENIAISKSDPYFGVYYKRYWDFSWLRQ